MSGSLAQKINYSAPITSTKALKVLQVKKHLNNDF